MESEVPVEIRVDYDAARRLLVYSWFAYRFIQIAEGHALGAVEMALRHRLGVKEPRRPGLKRLLGDAVAQGLPQDRAFRHEWQAGVWPDPGRARLSETALRLATEGRDQSDEYTRILVD